MEEFSTEATSQATLVLWAALLQRLEKKGILNSDDLEQIFGEAEATVKDRAPDTLAVTRRLKQRS